MEILIFSSLFIVLLSSSIKMKGGDYWFQGASYCKDISELLINEITKFSVRKRLIYLYRWNINGSHNRAGVSD